MTGWRYEDWRNGCVSIIVLSDNWYVLKKTTFDFLRSNGTWQRQSRRLTTAQWRNDSALTPGEAHGDVDTSISLSRICKRPYRTTHRSSCRSSG